MLRNKICRGTYLVTIEQLENRHLLACDFVEADPLPGDANMDCYINEADLIQVLKAGKLLTGEQATWEEGDWTGDGLFDFTDQLSLFTPHYQNGEAYDADHADEAINQLVALSTAGAADISIYYFPETGKVIAVPSEGKVYALHLVSRSGSFDGYRGNGAFDKITIHDQFVTNREKYDVADPPGWRWIEFSRLLPIGWTQQQVLDDLLVDGAMSGGGDLGNVRLGNRDDLPSELPDNVLLVAPDELPSFVSEEDANGLLTYDPVTGDVFIESWDELPFEGVELLSPDGLFTGTIGANDRYEERVFDEATPERVFRLSWDFDGVDVNFPEGFRTINLPGIAQTGLTEQEFFDGVHPRGSLDPEPGALRGAALKLTLAIGATFGECREHLANGTLIGDANVDGQFNSQDLVTIFQAGEYEDTELDNSTWSEGDWTCDGDFDTADLVAAFQAGQYEAPVAALAIRAYDEPSSARSGGENRTDGLLNVIELGESRMVGRKWLEAGSVDVPSYAKIAAEAFVPSDATDHVMADVALHLDFFE